MEDARILDLYWARDQRAIDETGLKYGPFLSRTAWNILRDRSDAEECVNDTYLSAWNAIPPARPSAFRAWLGRVVRNLSLDRWKRDRAEKRGAGLEVLLGELEDCVPAPRGTERALEDREIADLISAFLRRLTKESRVIFLRRYWYGDAIGEIAVRYGMPTGRVRVTLHRTRARLRQALDVPAETE